MLKQIKDIIIKTILSMIHLDLEKEKIIIYTKIIYLNFSVLML